MFPIRVRTATSTPSSRIAGPSPRRRPSGPVHERRWTWRAPASTTSSSSTSTPASPRRSSSVRRLSRNGDRQLTRTGGLSFAGGPWNNYVMHAIATVVGELRDRPGALGLVWANGGYVTKHSFGVYGTATAAIGLPPRRAAGRDRRRPAAQPHRRPTQPAAPWSRPTPSCTIVRAGRSTPLRVASWRTDGGHGARGADGDTVGSLCAGEWVARRQSRSTPTAAFGSDHGATWPFPSSSTATPARRRDAFVVAGATRPRRRHDGGRERASSNARPATPSSCSISSDTRHQSIAARPLLEEPKHAPYVHGESGLDGADLPDPARAEAGEDAVAFIVESARRGKASGWCRPVR